MKIEKFNENNLDIIRTDFKAFIKPFAEKYGIKIDMGGITFGDTYFSAKLNFSISEEFDPSKLVIGNVFKQASTKFEILEINHSTRKTVAITKRGKKYIIPFTQLATFIKIPGFPIDYKGIMEQYSNVPDMEIINVDPKDITITPTRNGGAKITINDPNKDIILKPNLPQDVVAFRNSKGKIEHKHIDDIEKF